MKNRMFKSVIKTGAIIMAFGLAACASTGSRSPDSVNSDEREKTIHERATEGREPGALKGDFTWLNEVEENFNRSASATSNRSVASEKKPEVLLKKKEWAFSYIPKTNHFYVNLDGTTYEMIQTRINDGERFAFAAAGQADNPLTFAVMRGDSRKLASGEVCETEISYWRKSKNAYVTDKVQVKGKNCSRLLSLLNNYVP